MDAYYQAADIFLILSIREPSGSVIFGSISNGVLLVAADYGGPGTHVTEDFGIKVSVNSPEEFVQGLAEGMRVLATDKALRLKMAKAAFLAAANRHQIGNIGDFFVELYRSIQKPPHATDAKPVDAA
ncbi:MAG: glycosyltransferase [Pseudomonadota bacterium]